MKRFRYGSLFILLIFSACSTLTAQQPATSTPEPTNTVAPTATALPTHTPTAVPTSTPNQTATAAVQATETSASVLKELDAVLGDSDIAYDQGHLAWEQAKKMNVILSGPSTDYLEVDGDLTAANFILKSDVTWEASGIIVCGFTFRSESSFERGKQYKLMYLRLSGLPAWEIDVFEFGRFKNSPSGTKFSDAIDQGNHATNQILLVAQDEQFTVYINGARQGRYFDNSKQRSDGFFAFEGSQESGKGSCEFENSWIWSLD
jgi:hypothetical protein